MDEEDDRLGIGGQPPLCVDPEPVFVFQIVGKLLTVNGELTLVVVWKVRMYL